MQTRRLVSADMRDGATRVAVSKWLAISAKTSNKRRRSGRERFLRGFMAFLILLVIGFGFYLF